MKKRSISILGSVVAVVLVIGIMAYGVFALTQGFTATLSTNIGFSVSGGSLTGEGSLSVTFLAGTENSGGSFKDAKYFTKGNESNPTTATVGTPAVIYEWGADSPATNSGMGYSFNFKENHGEVSGVNYSLTDPEYVDIQLTIANSSAFYVNLTITGPSNSTGPRVTAEQVSGTGTDWNGTTEVTSGSTSVTLRYKAVSFVDGENFTGTAGTTIPTISITVSPNSIS